VPLLNVSVELIWRSSSQNWACLAERRYANAENRRTNAVRTWKTPGKHGEKVRRTIYKRAERLNPKRI
jgi:hypothetical protein